MSETAKRIIPGSTLTTADTPYYTTPNNKQCVIKRLVMTNTGASIVSVTLNLPSSGGPSTQQNRIVSARSLNPGQSYVSTEAIGQVLESGGEIRGLATIAGIVSIVASGVEIS